MLRPLAPYGALACWMYLMNARMMKVTSRGFSIRLRWTVFVTNTSGLWADVWAVLVVLVVLVVGDADVDV